MKILIVGGSYFIGWHILQEISHEPSNEIFVLNRGSSEKIYPDGVKHLKADRNDQKQLSRVLQGTNFEVVIDTSSYNQTQTRLLLDHLITQGLKHFIHISTAAVYVEPFDLPIRETASTGKHDIWGEYGYAKLGIERLLMERLQDEKLPVTIIRPSYVYGPENYIDRESFIFRQLEKSTEFLVPGDGEAEIQLGYVEDLANSVVKIIGNNKSVGQIYNISSSEHIKIIDLVKLCAEIMGRPMPEIIKTDDIEDEIPDRKVFPFDNVTYYTNINKAASDLNWRPRTTLRNGLQNCYDLWKKGKYNNVRISIDDNFLDELIKKYFGK